MLRRNKSLSAINVNRIGPQNQQGQMLMGTITILVLPIQQDMIAAYQSSNFTIDPMRCPLGTIQQATARWRLLPPRFLR